MCEKIFPQRCYLKNHQNSVHNIKKEIVIYKCDSCGKSFARGYSMNKHIEIVYEGLKKYDCDSCE